MIGRKQSSGQEEWVEVYERIAAEPDRKRAETLVSEAASTVQQMIRGEDRVAFGWSGGKDSIALRVVAEAAGVKRSLLVLSALEYPAFVEWVGTEAPDGLHVEHRSSINWEWLAARPQMLFPQDSPTAAKWFANVQHRGQRDYCKREGVTAMLLGRRRADGNHLGQRHISGGHYYRDRGGFMRYSPISLWSHEDVLNVIVSYGYSLPPSYWWPRGFSVGTGPWAARQGTGSIENGWREVLQIDRSRVEAAVEFDLPGAAAALADD